MLASFVQGQRTPLRFAVMAVLAALPNPVSFVTPEEN